MRLNKSLFLFLGLFLATQVTAVASDDYPESSKKQLAVAEHVLEARLRYCDQFKALRADYYDFWLQSQPLEVRKKILWDLLLAAEDRCYGQQRNAYSDALIRHAAITGERAKLNDWIISYFSRPLTRKVNVDIPVAEYKKQLARLSQLPAYYMPFDLMHVVKLVAPYQEWLIDDAVRRAWTPDPEIKGFIINQLHIE